MSVIEVLKIIMQGVIGILTMIAVVAAPLYFCKFLIRGIVQYIRRVIREDKATHGETYYISARDYEFLEYLKETHKKDYDEWKTRELTKKRNQSTGTNTGAKVKAEDADYEKWRAEKLGVDKE